MKGTAVLVAIALGLILCFATYFYVTGPIVLTGGFDLPQITMRGLPLPWLKEIVLTDPIGSGLPAERHFIWESFVLDFLLFLLLGAVVSFLLSKRKRPF